MENNKLEIENAIYIGVCIYNNLRKSIVEIEDKFVSLEDKKILSLYLGILHTKNKVSSLLGETDLVKNTKINYKKLDSKLFYEIYNTYFNDIIDNINKESIEDYFSELLNRNIVIKLNEEYNFNVDEFINIRNKELIKK